MEGHKCAICGAVKHGGAIKKIDTNTYICSKGACRNVWDGNEDLIHDGTPLSKVLWYCKNDYNCYYRK